MTALVILAIVAAFYILRPKVTIAPTGETPPAATELFGEQPFPVDGQPIYSIGQTFHHRETGEKVEIIRSPEIVDGEYAIRWPSGDIGHIHQSSLKEFFE